MYGISQNVTEQAAAREGRHGRDRGEIRLPGLDQPRNPHANERRHVVGILHLLKREPLTADAIGLLDDALGCSTMLGQIINDVLDFSKIRGLSKLDLDRPAPTDPCWP